MHKKLLAGKSALITGAYRNLGALTAETLAEYGANIVINDLDQPELSHYGEEVLERVRAHKVEAAAVPADLSRGSEVRRLCSKALELFGRIDIIVNNAGPFNMDPYTGLKEEMWDLVMNVNLKAVYLITRELAPGMKSGGWGRVINMSAGSAFIRNHGVYTLAKNAVITITESLALELGPEITVNAIAPGQIQESLPDIHKIDPTFGDRYLKRVPAKRLVTRKEVANMIAMICTPLFDAVNGVAIRMDGGSEIPRF